MSDNWFEQYFANVTSNINICETCSYYEPLFRICHNLKSSSYKHQVAPTKHICAAWNERANLRGNNGQV